MNRCEYFCWYLNWKTSFFFLENLSTDGIYIVWNGPIDIKLVTGFGPVNHL